MGLVVVILDVSVDDRWDLIADPVGWALVVYGVLRLRGVVTVAGLLVAAVVATGVSVALVDKAFVDGLEPSTGWFLSLPHVVFDLILAGLLAGVLEASRPDLARRYRTLRWVFVVVAVGPVLLLGGGVDVLLVPLALVAVASYVYLVYLLFRSSGPLESVRGAPTRARDDIRAAPRRERP